MIFDVKFRWKLEVRRYRKRNSEELRISDSTAVEVCEVARAAAPVAFRYQGLERTAWEGRPIEIRTFGGRLWQPKPEVDHAAGAETVAALTSARLQAQLAADDKARGTPFALAGAHYDYGTSIELAQIGRCEFKGDPEATRAEVVQQLQELASDLLVVDGVVHEPASEPVYVIRTWGHRDEYGDIELGFVSGVDADTHPSRVFRADQAEHVIAEARSMDFGTPATALDPQHRIEVLMPDLVTFRYDMAPRLEKQARSICDSMANDLKDADLPFAATYIRLRDALNAGKLDIVAALVTDELIPVLKSKSERIEFKSWAEEVASELKEEWLRYGGDTALPSDHELNGLAG
jgi:hypothetical protein